MNRRLTAFVLALVTLTMLLAWLLGAGPLALAQDASATAGSVAATAPLALGDLSAELWPDLEGKTMVVVGLSLPETVPLPARVQIPLPAGATVDWVGEIMGPTPDKDIVRQYQRLTGKGGDYIELTLESTRVAQYEASYKAPGNDDGVFRSTLDWVQSVPARTLFLAARTSSRMVDVVITPAPEQAAPEFNEANERLYLVKSVTSPKPGSAVSFTVAYRTGAAQEPGSQQGGSSPIIVIAGVLLAVAVLGLIVALRMQRRRA